MLYSLAANTRITVGIVTGRALASVKHFVQITAAEQLNFIYAASHGFHIEAAGRKLHHRVGSHFIPILKAASLRVAASLRHIPGVVLEDNEFAVSVHYRYIYMYRYSLRFSFYLCYHGTLSLNRTYS